MRASKKTLLKIIRESLLQEKNNLNENDLGELLSKLIRIAGKNKIENSIINSAKSVGLDQFIIPGSVKVYDYGGIFFKISLESPENLKRWKELTDAEDIKTLVYNPIANEKDLFEKFLRNLYSFLEEDLFNSSKHFEKIKDFSKICFSSNVETTSKNNKIAKVYVNLIDNCSGLKASNKFV